MESKFLKPSKSIIIFLIIIEIFLLFIAFRMMTNLVGIPISPIVFVTFVFILPSLILLYLITIFVYRIFIYK
jgi:hypothetical protein